MNIEAYKLNKKGKVESKKFSSNIEALDYMYQGSPFVDRIYQGNCNPLIGKGSVRDKLSPNSDYVFFKDIEVIEELGLHLSRDGRVSNRKDDIGGLKKEEYTKYKLAGTSPSLEYGTKTLSYTLSKGLQYTFGVEIETSGGRLPVYHAIAHKLNLNCERDGSIAGGEYVTGVLKGDAGFLQLNKITGMLRQTCTIDSTCGIHVHIGGANFNKAFTVFSFILGLRLEQEVFKCLPPSRNGNKYCDLLSKLPMPSHSDLISLLKKYGMEAGVDMCYDILYKGMSYGDTPDENHNKLSPHKYGRYTGQYHNIAMVDNFRYKWLNLIPANFNMKGAVSLNDAKNKNTIEFRNHGASLSFTKIRNWVLFCMAFTHFVENRKSDIIDLNKTISISTILESAYGSKHKNLINYFEMRKQLFTKKGSENKEYTDLTEKQLKKAKNILCV